MELTLTYIISQIFVVGMYATLAITYFLKDIKKILIFNLLGSVFIGIAYFLLSAYTGLAMTFVAIFRNIIFLIYEKEDEKSIRSLIVIYLIIIVVTIPTYAGFLSLLSVFATALFTFSLWQKKTIVYKILGIPVSLLWVFYNIYIMSLFGILLESGIIVFAIVGFIIELKRRSRI